ncbi:TPA: hypothetical protein RJ683_004379 [Escherichia coli]|nr:hypothetical protein [Escherichia coli]
MKVYIVEGRNEYEDPEVLGVFGTQESAKHFVDMEQGTYDFIFVTEWGVQQ